MGPTKDRISTKARNSSWRRRHSAGHRRGHRHRLPGVDAGAQHDGWRKYLSGQRAGRKRLNQLGQALCRNARHPGQVPTGCQAAGRGETLGVGKMQMVEIAKALSENAKILILDEPTSALTEAEIEKLMEILENLRKPWRHVHLHHPQTGRIFPHHRLGDRPARRQDRDDAADQRSDPGETGQLHGRPRNEGTFPQGQPQAGRGDLCRRKPPCRGPQ